MEENFMQEKLSKEKLHSALFMNLVMSLYTAAMQQLGKLKSPIVAHKERQRRGGRDHD